MAGPIQSAVNQMIGMGAVIKKLSPEAEEERQDKLTQKMIEAENEFALGQQGKLKEIGAYPPQDKMDLSDEDVDTLTNTVDLNSGLQMSAERQVEAYKKLYEHNPSSESLKNYVDASNRRDELAHLVERDQKRLDEFNSRKYVPNDETRAEQANNQPSTQQTTRNKRRDFIRDYLSQMESVRGMTPEQQRAIAANYSPKERQRIMNQQDKEKGGKK